MSFLGALGAGLGLGFVNSILSSGAAERQTGIQD